MIEKPRAPSEPRVLDRYGQRHPVAEIVDLLELKLKVVVRADPLFAECADGRMALIRAERRERAV